LDSVVHGVVVLGGIGDDRGVGRLVSDGVRRAVDAAVRQSVDGAMHGLVERTVRGTLGGAGSDRADEAMCHAVRGAMGGRSSYMGGQFWADSPWHGAAWTAFVREVAGLALPGDLWDRARAWEATIESACCWWPTPHFVMASERPTVIRVERVGPGGPHRLHCENGPAIAWDGWELHYLHGVRVPAKAVLAPEALTPREVLREPNAEVRRVMIQRLGADRLLARAMEEGRARAGVLHEETDQLGQRRRLLRLALHDDEPLVMIEVTNSTAEPDGTWKHYLLRVPPTMRTCQEAVAWTFGLSGDEYAPGIET
jgi:hypothetical protein